MGGRKLDIMNLCCKKEREKCGNNVCPGLLLLADLLILPFSVAAEELALLLWVVFLFHQESDEPAQATFFARLEVRKC